jgi:hypothetical protein
MQEQNRGFSEICHGLAQDLGVIEWALTRFGCVLTALGVGLSDTNARELVRKCIKES